MALQVATRYLGQGVKVNRKAMLVGCWMALDVQVAILFSLERCLGNNGLAGQILMLSGLRC